MKEAELRFRSLDQEARCVRGSVEAASVVHRLEF